MMANRTTRKRDYEVGYGKPPEHSRFKKGQSGNPNGRPRKAKVDNRGLLSDILFEECQQPMTVMINGTPVEMPMERAIMRSTLIAALNRNPTAMRLAREMIAEARTSPQASYWPTKEEINALGPHEISEAYKRMMQAKW